MSTEAAPAQPPRKVIRWRLLGATPICLFILAATIPNLGRVDVVTRTIRYGWPDALWILLTFVPLIVILIGADRSWTAERIGWGLLLILLALAAY